MANGISVRVRCPSCQAWGLLHLDFPTDAAEADARRSVEIVYFACPNQGAGDHRLPAQSDLDRLIPAALAPRHSHAG